MKIIDNKYLAFHYCSVNSFIKIITTNEIWLSDITKSNDYLESRFIPNKLDEEHEKLFENFKKNYVNLFICFSQDSDSLSQWIKYADDATGICIGFDRSYLDSLKEKFQKCVFEGNFIFDSVKYYPLYNTRRNVLFNHEMEIYNSILNKTDGFKDEKEERFIFSYDQSKINMQTTEFRERLELDDRNGKYMPKIYYRESKKFICPYIRMDLSKKIKLKMELNDTSAIRKVIIGPKSLIEINDVQAMLLNSGYNLDEFDISKSSIPYR